MKMPVLLNFINFQIGWFACVLGAAWGYPWAGVVVALAVAAWHCTHVAQPRRELMLLAAAALIGAAWDSLLLMSGWIQYPNGMLVAGAAPVWIVALWVLFATTLNVSLAWLKRSPLLALAFGAMGGPLAYYAGAKLGALVFVDQTAALIALAAGWALLTPLLLQLAKHFDGGAAAGNGHFRQEPRHG